MPSFVALTVKVVSAFTVTGAVYSTYSPVVL